MIPISLVTLLEITVVHLTKGGGPTVGRVPLLVVMMALVMAYPPRWGSAEMTGNLEGLTISC